MALNERYGTPTASVDLVDDIEIVRGAGCCRRTALVVSSSVSIRRQISRVLGNCDLEIALLGSPHKAAQLAKLMPFDLLLLEYTSTEAIEQFVERLEDSTAVCHRVPLIVLDESQDELSGLGMIQCGACQVLDPGTDEAVLSLWAENPDLAAALQPIRALVRLEASGFGSNGKLAAQTRWMSASQMLIRLGKQLPFGHRFDFSIDAVGLSRRLHGKAEVSRLPGGESFHGREVMAKIVDFDGDDKYLFTSFLQARQPKHEVGQ